MTTIAAAIIAASVAVIGYLVNQRNLRIERKTRLYADALKQIRAYQELPYEIWRRTGDDPEEVRLLSQRVNAAYSGIQFHLQRLQIESPTVAQAYLDLYEQTGRQSRINRQRAWQDTMSTSGLKPDEDPFRGDNGREIDLCVEAMRAEISLLRFVRHGGINRKLTALREYRATVPVATVQAEESASNSDYRK